MTVISGTPAYIQVATDLRSKIESGAFGPGSKLPSNAQLRTMYSVSNTVVRDAINELRRSGLVVGQQGKGVFVTSAADITEGKESTGLAERVQAIEERVRSLQEDDVQDLRNEIAVLRTYLIDLYVRMGLPYPREMTVSGGDKDKEPSAKPTNRSA